jgi:hypothetical protein
MKSMYYGTIKGPDGTIYRSEKAFETQEAAMDWATETATRLADDAKAIGMPTDLTEIIRNSAGVVDQLKGYEYSSVLPSYAPKTEDPKINPDALLPGTTSSPGDPKNSGYVGVFYDDKGNKVNNGEVYDSKEKAEALIDAAQRDLTKYLA